MTISNADTFSKYLQEDCKYPFSAIRINKYKYNKVEHGRVEVCNDDGAIIQAFIVMSEKDIQAIEKFPFYRTYYQRNTYGYIVNPACNIAVHETKDDSWHIYSANNARHEICNPEFLNYEKAVKRFKERFDYFGNKELAKEVKYISYISLAVILSYCFIHLLSVNGCFFGCIIPLNEGVVYIMIISIVLLLLPPLIPYIKSVSIKDINFELD